MDPYDDYMKEREDWQNEIAKRDEEIRMLKEHLGHSTSERDHWFSKVNIVFEENLELKKELRKRWETIVKMGKALEWYADKDNIENRIKETSRWSAGEWITSTSMYDDVTKVAEEALKEPR